MSQESPISRRELLRAATAGAVAVGASVALQPMNVFANGTSTEQNSMPTRPLGLTGVNVFPFSLGGQGLLEIPGHTDEAVAIINRAIDLGVKYFDSAWWYGNGSSETYYGEALKTRRKEIYLATKSGERTYDGAMRNLDESLKRLKTDHLDCWQMHNVRTNQDVEAIFATNGALKAFQKARDERITRFIGITGHRNPFVLKDAIGRFSFDTILMALNAADVHLDGTGDETSFIKNLLPLAVEKKMGIIGMKVSSLAIRNRSVSCSALRSTGSRGTPVLRSGSRGRSKSTALTFVSWNLTIPRLQARAPDVHLHQTAQPEISHCPRCEKN